MARKSRKNVGLIGLGIIGSRIAAGLRAAGYHVFVWNRTPKPAPNFVGSPAEVAEICDVIQIFVADAAAAREVIEAFGEQLGPRHTIINCATIGPEATVEIAQAVQSRGASYLDCPFTGSKGAAEKAQLVYYVGGDEAVFLRAKPVLEATSRAIVRCGRVGDASTLKIATNLITAVTTQTLAEALAIVQGAGIKPEAFAAALEHNACKSGVVELKLPKMISGDYEPHFSVKHMFKDVQLGIHLANEHRLEVPLTTVVGGVLYGALCNGWGDLDFASLYRVYSDAPSKQEPAALPPQIAEEPKQEAPKVEPAPAPTEIVAEAPVAEPPVVESPVEVEPVSPPPPIEPALAVEPPVNESQSAAGVESSGNGSEAAPIDLQKLEETKAENAVVPEPVEAQPPAAEASPSSSNGSDDAPEDDNGLSGFFSRVFRRKGTPVGK